MVPNSIGAAVAFLALQAIGRVPAMLNHTAGVDAMLSACRTAQLRIVVTLAPVYRIGQARRSCRTARGRRRDRLARGFARPARPVSTSCMACWHRVLRGGSIAGSASLPPTPPRSSFTSVRRRAERRRAEPRNLLANRRQLAARVDFSPADQVLNALRCSNSFGLTPGSVAAAVRGAGVSLTPPAALPIVPELAYGIGATLLFGTDTFLAGYARAANPYDFYALRYVFAGAEAVRRRNPPGLGRALRQAHPGGLWRDRMCARHRRQHADAFQTRHGRPALCR